MESARSPKWIRRSSGPRHSLGLGRTSPRLSAVHRGFGESYGTTIGNAYDLLGGLEASSAVPTDAERLTLDRSRNDLTATIGKLNDIITTELPKLRAAIAQLPPLSVTPVAPPH